MLEFLLQAVDDVTMDQKTAITEAINAIVENESLVRKSALNTS